MRNSVEAAISDVRAACEDIPPDEFARLARDDEVTFLIARAHAELGTDGAAMSFASAMTAAMVGAIGCPFVPDE